MPAIDVTKFKKQIVTLPHLPEPDDYPQDAQPTRVDQNLDRFRPLAPSERPGLLVSARTKDEVMNTGQLSVAPLYRNGLHLFYGGELPNNRFMMRFYKNAHGANVVNIPQVKNLLENLPNWEFGFRFDCDTYGYISVDIVGMIYLKVHFP